MSCVGEKKKDLLVLSTNINFGDQFLLSSFLFSFEKLAGRADLLICRSGLAFRSLLTGIIVFFVFKVPGIGEV